VTGVLIKTDNYWFVAVPLFVVVVVAGGEDISSCFAQPINIADTAATKNNNFFIPLFPSFRPHPAAKCG
jgi:hypothetical protein